VVVGAGIAGLSAALGLSLIGWRVVVLERRADLPADGATITLWPNGVTCLTDLGINAAALGTVLDGVEVRQLDGTLLGVSPLDSMRKRYGVPVVTIERKILLKALAETLPENSIRFGISDAKIAENTDQHIAVTTSCGLCFDADILIAADGANSGLRSQIAGPAQISYSAVRNWLGNLPISIPGVQDTIGIEYLGPDRRLGLMPLPQGVYFRLSTYLPDDTTPFGTSPADIAWWTETLFPDPRPTQITAFIKAVQNVSKDALYCLEERDIDPIERWNKGRAVLIGDAAHAMTSGLGQGGNQALEDAFTLARTLSPENLLQKSLPAALGDFVAERATRANDILLASRAKTRLFQPMSPDVMAHWYDRMDDISSPDSLAGIHSLLEGFEPLRAMQRHAISGQHMDENYAFE
jgi:FAD-dependent urate hydroxylase